MIYEWEVLTAEANLYQKTGEREWRVRECTVIVCTLGFQLIQCRYILQCKDGIMDYGKRLEANVLSSFNSVLIHYFLKTAEHTPFCAPTAQLSKIMKVWKMIFQAQRELHLLHSEKAYMVL